MKPLLVVNPASGGGRTGRTFAEMRGVVERALGDVDVAMTERRGHGMAIAEGAAKGGRELVVAVGGDGTFNEVVNGVLSAGGRASVGLIAQGTGGDFRRTLGLEHRLERYLEALASGRERAIDVGRVRFRGADGREAERYFVNIVSAGIGGLVDRFVEGASPALGGTAKYAVASVRALAASGRGTLRCAIANGEQSESRAFGSYMIAVCNGRFFGSGMHVAPMADVADGRLEIVSIDAPSKLAFALAARKIYDGAHLGERGVTHFACDRVTVELENDRAASAFLIDIDGEPLGRLPMHVELVPRALKLRA